MAHYAKISNEEFTESESARLSEAQSEKGAIEADNTASDGYVALQNMFKTKGTSDTLENLQAELNALYADRENPPAQEDVDALNTAIQAEKDTLDEEAQELLEQMEILEAEGTEDLVAEIEVLNTAIANALCRVTAMCTGADEFVSPDGDETEIDHTVYWEGFYGGCKRTSYNTQGGVHKLGGTPFRKNYAGVGYIYDPVRDAFYNEQPYTSWTLDESTCYWQPPTPRPEEGVWYWNEDTLEWIEHPGFKKYSNWIYDEAQKKWVPPVEYPNDGSSYRWNQETSTWDFIESTQPYPSWIWNTELSVWEAPIPKPGWTWDSDKELWIPPTPYVDYDWDEETQNWIENGNN